MTVIGDADGTHSPVRPAPGRPERLPHLDALRGLAAAVVLAHHTVLALSQGDRTATAWNALNVVLIGRPAVILFFVLSGFVLTLHLQTSHEGYLGFVIRRLIRLLVPYGAAILLAFVAFRLVPRQGTTGLSPWLDTQWKGDLGPTDLFRHLALLAGPRQFPLDHVAWSLVHELRLSLLLPVFLIGLWRVGPGFALCAAGGVVLVAEAALAAVPGLVPAGVYGLRFDTDNVVISLALTARFSLAFALGAVLATHGAPLAGVMRRPAAGLLGLAIGWALLSVRNEAAMAFGATVLIGAAAENPRLAAALRLPPLLWFGRLSYSLYLIHLPIMLACACLWRGHGPAPVGLLAGLVLSVPVAAAMARWIEEPSIQWSRAAARMLSRRDRGHSVRGGADDMALLSGAAISNQAERDRRFVSPALSEGGFKRMRRSAAGRTDDFWLQNSRFETLRNAANSL